MLIMIFPGLLTKDSTQCAARESGNEIHLKTISIKAVKLKKKSSYNGNINYLENKTLSKIPIDASKQSVTLLQLT